MQRRSWVVLVLLVVSFGIGVRDVRALPVNEVWDTFFVCSGEEVGYRILGCDNVIYSGGQQSGDYKLREWTNCTYGNHSSAWYYWNGSGWTQFTSTPTPNCQ